MIAAGDEVAKRNKAAGGVGVLICFALAFLFFEVLLLVQSHFRDRELLTTWYRISVTTAPINIIVYVSPTFGRSIIINTSVFRIIILRRYLVHFSTFLCWLIFYPGYNHIPRTKDRVLLLYTRVLFLCFFLVIFVNAFFNENGTDQTKVNVSR